jgi:hypothetical protein
MPYWSENEEKTLMEKLSGTTSLEELAESLHRSPEAVAMKLKRMGLSVPPREKHSVISERNKVTKNKPTTTTPKLEPFKFEDLPSPNEAMGLLWAAVRRLQDPDVEREEAKKLRLILQGVKSYIHLDADYVMRIRHIETGMLLQWRHIASELELQIEQMKGSQEKDKLKAHLSEVQQHIKEMVEMGIKEPRKEPRTVKEVFLS